MNSGYVMQKSCNDSIWAVLRESDFQFTDGARTIGDKTYVIQQIMLFGHDGTAMLCEFVPKHVATEKRVFIGGTSIPVYGAGEELRNAAWSNAHECETE